MGRASRHARWEMAGGASGALYPTPGFVPSDLSIANGGPLAAWPRVSNATLVSGDVSILPDFLNSNPAVQTVAGRRPMLENSANGLPCMRFATNDVLSWPVIGSTANVSTWGFGTWVKLDALAGIQMLYSAVAATGGASANRLRFYQQTTGLTCEVYASGTVGRFGHTAAILTTGWQFVTIEYDDAGATEALKLTITLGGTIQTLTFGNQGAGAAIGSLVAITGNHLIGDSQDGVAQFPLNGLCGPNPFLFGAKMASAPRGLLTPQARLDFMSYQRPT